MVVCPDSLEDCLMFILDLIVVPTKTMKSNTSVSVSRLLLALLPRDDDDCGCPHRSYGEEYDSGEIKRWVHSHSCESEHCIFQVEPGCNSSLMLSLESITLNSYDSLKLSQYFVINETEIVSLHYVDLSSSYRRSIFTAGVGVGFEIEYKFQQRRWYGSSSFTLSFERVGPDIKTCPFPLLCSSVDFTNVPDIERLGPIRCPFRILPSVSGRKILLKFHDIRGTIFYEKQENGYLRAIPSEVVKLHSTSDYIDFVLESLSPHHLPRYNITFKELTEDPCHCDKSDVFVGSKPVYITSPGFPEIYCSNFRCKRRFVHNDTLRHDSELTFVVTVHFLSTEKFDYIQFSSDGINMERLNGTHEDVRLVFTGDIMETEFVTDEAIVRHGYNMLFTISGKLARRQWEISKNSRPVTILYERNVQANSSLPSAMTSFLVSWMPSEGCSCDNGSIKTAVVGEWDVLTSPAYPLSYCNDMLCVTRIVAPEGHHVVLNITDFYTEPYNDVLALFDGWNITGRHIEVFHGKKRFPYLIRNSNETLSLVFKSDHEVYYQGFRLLFSAEPNEDIHLEAHSSVHFSTIIIILLSIMLVATVIVAVFRRVPVRFENPLYVASVSYSDRAEYVSRNLIQVLGQGMAVTYFLEGSSAISTGERFETMFDNSREKPTPVNRRDCDCGIQVYGEEYEAGVIKQRERIQDVKVCPHPLLLASTSFRTVPAIERPGPVRCPFRIIPSVAGRKIYLKFNKMWGTSLFLNEEQSNLRLIQTGTSGLHSATDSIDFVLESLGHHDLPKYNITYKELLEDPCYCDNKDIVVGEEPLYVTSPGFPDIYCSDFRCKRRFLHNDTLREDASLTFLVTVHFLSTEKYDYIEFSSGGVVLDRLNGTYENYRIIITDDIMETEFVTDKTIVQHGYNMTVQSVHIPTECRCPHKGVKKMLSKGNISMEIPVHCEAIYCKWIIPPTTTPLKFAALFNFTSDYDTLTVTTGDDIQQFYTISEKLTKRQWQIPEKSPSTTILYERTVPDGLKPNLKPVSFSVKWMPKDEDCSCTNGSEKEAAVGEWKELTSPVYPLSYCNDMHCTTVIRAPARHRVVLNITDFYTEPYNDVLLIYDGSNPSGQYMKMFSGKRQFPNLIRSTNETLSLVFKSDHDISYYGYRLIYSAEFNEELEEMRQTTHFTAFLFVLLSLILITAIVVAIYKGFPGRFHRLLYVHYVSQTDTVE
ncbi:unnamed protein product [Haemonchus placei]|uniref:CUB domain-containing protein n=1 Tax=Haemonchus placei TaxID=6290 RepID=A0A158QKD9_HAEPC|nr:unnamed protein product [Haemonchus placei]